MSFGRIKRLKPLKKSVSIACMLKFSKENDEIPRPFGAPRPAPPGRDEIFRDFKLFITLLKYRIFRTDSGSTRKELDAWRKSHAIKFDFPRPLPRENIPVLKYGEKE
jgi:hypothetical protein